MPGERGSVIIVEDTEHSAELIAALVDHEGFNSVVCSSASAARDVYRTQKPVAILLDWVLPDAPGTELCREMRAKDPLVTIIFVSGRGDEMSVARARRGRGRLLDEARPRRRAHRPASTFTVSLERGAKPDSAQS